MFEGWSDIPDILKQCGGQHYAPGSTREETV